MDVSALNGARVLKRFSEIMESRRDELRELIVSEIGSVHFLTDYLQVGGAIEASHYYGDFVEHDVTWVEAPGAPVLSPTGLGGTIVVREPVGAVRADHTVQLPLLDHLGKPLGRIGPSVALSLTTQHPCNAEEWVTQLALIPKLPPYQRVSSTSSWVAVTWGRSCRRIPWWT